MEVTPTPKSASGSQITMRVKKRNGSMEPVNVGKIVRAISRSCGGLADVDAMKVATRTISGLYDGASTSELDRLSIQTAAALIVEEPQYSKLAATLLSTYIDKEVRGQGIHAFSMSVKTAHQLGLVNDRLLDFVAKNSRKFNDTINVARDLEFEYFGLRTVYDRYLLRNPQTREVIENPQQFFMRIACAISESAADAVELYKLFSSLEYLPGSPTLFNSGTLHEQLSSCYLLDSPEDSIEGIYQKYQDIALLSKYSGGIGLAYHRIRSRGSLIKGTNGHSNGVVPWLKTLDSSVVAVNQGGKRKGACCVYLETWHADIEEFLELRDNTGDEASRTHNLNLANWIPDLFMKRVEADGTWSLFDPKEVPLFPDLYGWAFEQAYEKAEAAGKASKTLKARDLYARMMRTLAQTGNGWMTFKDKSNSASNQTGQAGAIHLSNLCTEILEITSATDTAVCNLGSINLGRHMTVKEGKTTFDWEKLASTVRLAVRQLDRVIDLNFYPIQTAKNSNTKWRPIGLGVMGLQDVFFQMRLPFDSVEARDLSRQIAAEIYYWALSASVELAKVAGPHPTFSATRAQVGTLQFDSWGVKVEDTDRMQWSTLRQQIMEHGLRNSLLIAIAPTATIASIAGAYECIEPQISNLFKRESLSGDFVQINRYLVAELKALGLWTDATRSKLKMTEGSIQSWQEVPQTTKDIFRTVWEVPMRSLVDMAADRGAFIDQSQSLNLFIENPNIGQLSSMYMYAWKKGLKTTYYLRSRPATKIAKATVETANQVQADGAAVACSLENPSLCEACQ